MTVEHRTAAKRALTRDEAAVRAAEVGELHYTFTLDLARGDREFATSTVARFHVRTGAAPVFLDFTGEVDAVECDGSPVPGSAHDGTRVRLDVGPGAHTVRVTGRAQYSRTGEGLHRFRDPLDGRVYLHTKFEPFAAHTVFACFDQPDLKATVELTVTAEDGWVVIANAEPADPDPPAAGGRRVWRFRPTPPLPPYLVAFAAGPFRRIGSRHGPVPMGLYARDSLAAELTADAPEIFDVVAKGLDFFASLFGVPYPFGKYDQVFAPEYAFGGMEHPGCVTLNERFLFRHRVTADTRRRRAEVLLHEMAHMWFGDYVTMRWWDDLWLNESFAEAMSVAAQAEVTPYGDGWTPYAHHALPAARHAERLPTSHPIRAVTGDTDAARVNFGPIVYKRGAAVLHDLAEHLGWVTFTAGVRAYLRAHAWGNATLDDFVAALRRVSGADVDRWVAEWVLRRGINTVEVSRTGNGARVTQTADRDGGRRHLTVRCAGFDDRDGALVLRDQVTVPLTPDRPAASEIPAADLLVPNADAVCHVAVRLDPESRRAALRALSTVEDARTRAVVWGALWDDVLDARLAARDYATAVLTHAQAEPDAGVVEALGQRAVQALREYADPADRDELLAAWADGVRDRLARAAPGSDQQFVLARVLVDALPGHDDLLTMIARGRPPWPGLRVDPGLRWRAVLRLAVTGRGGGGGGGGAPGGPPRPPRGGPPPRAPPARPPPPPPPPPA
ncbi:aminopeptidase N, partial [Amycolatopsis thermoflava]|uniref:aminopeptidase N n=1 Tax=Amycolatopsis thermoflava TaxID=84480 RepID=UPI003663773F